jgi:hypothetical protein
MSAVAIAIGGSALIGYMASQNAASAQEDAANNATNAQLGMYNTSLQQQQPFRESGLNALNQLNQQLPELTRGFTMADFQNDPGYQFQLQQGQQAIERSAAARGGGIGGSGTAKSLLGYSQGLAAQDYQNAFNRFNTTQSNTYNRLANMAGLGQSASNVNSQNAMTTGAQVGQNIQAAGNAQAAGYVGGANAIQNGVNSGVNNWMSQQYLNQLNGAGTQYGSNPTANWQPTQLQMPNVGGSY